MDAISLPPELESKIVRVAQSRGLSVAEYVRQSLENAVAQEHPVDPLYADNAVYRDEGPADCASNHDDYLYGDDS